MTLLSATSLEATANSCGGLRAQESPPDPEKPAQFLINITEFSVPFEAAQKFDRKDWNIALQQGQTDGVVQVVETVEFAAFVTLEARVQFGRNISVPVRFGPTGPNRQPAQAYQNRQLGTMASAMLHQKQE